MRNSATRNDKIMMNRRQFFATTLGGVATTALPGFIKRADASGQTTHAVVELFTSQGCSSCPPADRVVAGLAQRPGIMTLSYHVDYWDYLGWKDTLANPENTARQYRYREALGNRSVYTPQVVINGTEDLVGSQGARIDAVLGAATPLPVNVAVAKVDDTINIDIDGPAMAEKTLITLVYFKSRTEVPVRAGENGGHTLTYTNSVQKMMTLGMWDGGTKSIRMPVSDMKTVSCDGCAVLVQRTQADNTPRAIVGGASWQDGTV